jgi:hypothetical protein
MPLFNPTGASDHPDLATHDTLGLATDAELTTHVGAADPHTGYVLESDHTSAAHDTLGLTTDALLATAISDHAGAADPHTGYLKENDANWTDLTDGGATVLHSHAGGSGAPTDADYLVGTANGTLSNEIVVGTTPGGELGGTWASPTVDATHSGSTHGAAVTTHEAAGDPHTGYRLESADHTHATTGLQGGTIAHSALTGLTAGDDHTQYLKEADANWVDLTDGGATTLHSHAGGSGPTLISSGAAPAAGAVNSAAAPSETWLLNTADNAVTTVETVMSVTGLAAGTYLYEYYIVWRSGATGTGTSFAVDYTGTVTRTRMTRHYQSTGAAAATGVSDGVSAVLTGTLVEHMSANSDNGALGPTTGVASTTEDQFDLIRGIMVVSTGGDLNLTMTGEANGAVTFKADSMMILKRLA